MITNNLTFIKSRVLSMLGSPPLKLESEILVDDIDWAMLRFYQARPISRTYSTTVTEYAQEQVFDIAGLINSQFPAIQQPEISLGTLDGNTAEINSANLSPPLYLAVPVKPGSVTIKKNGTTSIATDDGVGNLLGLDGTIPVTGSVNYLTGQVIIQWGSTPPLGQTVSVVSSLDNSAYYCLGVLNQDFDSNFLPRYTLDKYLLGVDIHYDPTMEMEPLRTQLRLVAQRRSTGQITIEMRMESGPRGQIVVICNGTGQLAMTFAFGHTMTQYIPFNYLQLVTNLTAEAFIRRLLAVRASVTVSSDFEVSTTFMENLLNELVTKNQQDIEEASTPVLLWG